MSFYVHVLSCWGSWSVGNVSNLQVGIAKSVKLIFSTPSQVEQHSKPHSSGTSCSHSH